MIEVCSHCKLQNYVVKLQIFLNQIETSGAYLKCSVLSVRTAVDLLPSNNPIVGTSCFFVRNDPVI